MTAQVIDLNAKRLERATNSFKTIAEERGHNLYEFWKETGSDPDNNHFHLAPANYEIDPETGDMVQTIHTEDGA